MLITAANLSSSIFTGAPRNLKLGAFFGSQALETGKTLINPVTARAMVSTKINSMETKVDVVSIKNDPRKPEDMKVDELKTALRKFGAPTKGRKHELISSLKSLLAGENYVLAGEKSLGEDRETEMSLETNAVYTETISQGKLKKQVVSLTATVRQGNGKKKALGDGSVAEESKVEAVVTREKNVTKSTELPGKRSSSKRKLAAETSSKQDEASAAAKDFVATNEPWTIFAHKKPQKGWVAYNPRTMRPPPLGPSVKAVKIMSWNVNGLRALLKSEGLAAVELAARENFDVLCLQETKIQDKDVETVKDMLEDYEHEFWTCSTSKLGYSGTAIISRIKPLSVKYGLGISDHDSEGRLVTAEFESFYLLNSYVPNSGDGLKRLSYRIKEWDVALSSYMKELEKSKPVILTGDLNCAHQEIDIYNPAGNKRSAGFTDEERQSFEKCYLNNGFVDTFRKQHPGVVGYTYWGYRHNGRKTNRGWRLDYFLASQSIADNAHDSFILPDINGSDHCPIGLVLKL